MNSRPPGRSRPATTSARRHRHERVRFGRVGPPHRQRELPAQRVEEEDPILRPRRPNRQEHELPVEPRMERMRHSDSSLITTGIERI
jgi:hypothetical protein